MARGKRALERSKKTTTAVNMAKKNPPKPKRKRTQTKQAPSPEFHQYQKLPGELKLMIWQEALRPKPSIQYVKITRGGPATGLVPGSIRDIPLATRQEVKKSAWCDLASIKDVGKSDRGAKEMSSRLPSQIGLCKVEGLPWQRGKNEKWQHTLSIDPENDIVCLHFDLQYTIRYDFVRHSLPPALCRLRRVAIDLDDLECRNLPEAQKWSFLETLQCSCYGLSHKKMAFCPVKLTYLIALIRGAGTIYVLVRIGRLKDLSEIGQRFLRVSRNSTLVFGNGNSSNCFH